MKIRERCSAKLQFRGREAEASRYISEEKSDDCILYHTIRCCEEGVTDDEFEETMTIGLIVSGSITIPHLRRAFKHWEALTTKHQDE